MNGFDRTFLRLNRALIGGMMFAMFVLVFINVVGRYAFQVSYAPAEEISTFLMIWVAYLGAGLALREGRHAAIDMLQDRLPPPARRLLRILLAGVMLCFFAALVWLGICMSIFGWSQETIATQIPTGIPYLAVPLGGVFFCIHLVLSIRAWIERRWQEGQPEETTFRPEEESL